MAAPQRNMPAPNLPIDPRTGRVPVTNKETGKVTWLHPVDAREQLSNMLRDKQGEPVDPIVRLATPAEAPPEVAAPLVNWKAVPFEQLREHAQNAGVKFQARTRAQIEEDLTQAAYIPPQSSDE